MDNSSPTTGTPQSTPHNPKPKNGTPITVVMSKLEAELAAERARVETELALSRANRNKMITKKIVLIIVVAIITVALVGILVFVLINSFFQSHPGTTNPDEPEPTPGQILPNIEGYSCTTSICSKAADLSDDTILIRDTAYFVFDRETKQTMKTTIDAIDFRSFIPFNWGESLLLILEPTTGHQGLYSITANRFLTSSFNYTSFDHDINSEVYRDMQWVEGRYILTTIPPQTILLDVRDGKELIRAVGKIFIHEDFILGYEAEGQRRIYTHTGLRVVVANAPSFLVIYDHHLIQVTATRSIDIYDRAGEKLKTTDDYYRNIRTQLQATRLDYADALRSLPGVFIIPD